MSLSARDRRALLIAVEEMADEQVVAKIIKTLHDPRMTLVERYETARVFIEVLEDRAHRNKPQNGD